MRIVVAVGGNALLPRGGRLDAEVQLHQLGDVARDRDRAHHLAPLVAHG